MAGNMGGFEKIRKKKKLPYSVAERLDKRKRKKSLRDKRGAHAE